MLVMGCHKRRANRGMQRGASMEDCPHCSEFRSVEIICCNPIAGRKAWVAKCKNCGMNFDVEVTLTNRKLK